MDFIFEKINPFSLSEYEKEIQFLLSASNQEPIWQSLEWTRMLIKTWYASESFLCGIKENDQILSFCVIEKRSIWAGQFWLFCLGWPIGENKYTEPLIEQLPKLFQKDAPLFIQVEPLDSNIIFSKKWRKWAHKKFIEQHTTIIDLTLSDEEILSAMKPKWRYNIRVAEKHEVITEWVSCSQANVRQFYHLLTETTKRDSFATNTLSYFLAFWEYLEDNHLWWLLFARKDGELLAAWLFVFYGKTALYYYGASVSESEKRKFMASYLLQWEAIKEAKRRNCLTYDFLWIAPENEPDHHLAGVTDFKLKLSPTTKTWPDALLHIQKPVQYFFFMIAKFFRWILKK